MAQAAWNPGCCAADLIYSPHPGHKGSRKRGRETETDELGRLGKAAGLQGRVWEWVREGCSGQGARTLVEGGGALAVLSCVPGGGEGLVSQGALGRGWQLRGTGPGIVICFLVCS